jgi:LPS-assembly lipoprotein
MPLKAWILILTCLPLAACSGWHLRGSIDLPPTMQRTYIQSAEPNSLLALDLSHTLTNNHVQVQQTPIGASAVLRLDRERIDRQVVAVNANGKALQYGFFMQVSFRVEAVGKVLVPDQEVTAYREYVFNSQDVLGNQSREDLLLTDMRHQLIDQILERLRYTKVQSQPQQSSKATHAAVAG